MICWPPLDIFLRYGGYAVLGDGQSDLQLLGHMQ